MNRVILVCSAIGFLFGGRADKEAELRYFPGGKSEISSDDPRRAEKAIRKWSEKESWAEEGQEKRRKTDPEDSPYFWDFDAVGRDVFLRVIKNSNRTGSLEVWLEDRKSKQFELFKRYRIATYSGGPGPKFEQGDRQAPEGFYFVRQSRMNPLSDFHLSMDLGYPNAYDRHHGRTGDFLMIHGKNVSLGCFAMTDASIEQIYTLVSAALANGQPIVRVHCFPFAMTEEAMEASKGSEHFEFWKNLKEGWDWFERERRPPDVDVQDGKYVFSKTGY